MGAGLVDFYRGRKKFDDKVIQKVKEESIMQFKVQYGLEELLDRNAESMSVSSDKRKTIPVQDDYSDNIYSFMKYRQPQETKRLEYVRPRANPGETRKAA